MTLTEVALLESKLGTEAAVRYKLLVVVDRDTQMSLYKEGGQHDDEMIIHDWKDKVQLLNDYSNYRQQFMNMLIKFQPS